MTSVATDTLNKPLYYTIFKFYEGRSISDVPQFKKKQEAQLMLTNPQNTFRGQSRSPNIVPYDMLDMVSY